MLNDQPARAGHREILSRHLVILTVAHYIRLALYVKRMRKPSILLYEFPAYCASASMCLRLHGQVCLSMHTEAGTVVDAEIMLQLTCNMLARQQTPGCAMVLKADCQGYQQAKCAATLILEASNHEGSGICLHSEVTVDDTSSPTDTWLSDSSEGSAVTTPTHCSSTDGLPYLHGKHI